MRLLLVTHDYLPHNRGGVEVYTASLARALRARGVEASVLHGVTRQAAGVFVEDDEHDGVPVHRLVGPPGDLSGTVSDPARETAFEGFLRERAFDVVHVHHLMRSPMALVGVTRRVGLPVAVTLHDFWLLCPRAHLFVEERETRCTGPASPEACARCLTTGRTIPDRTAAALRAHLAARLEAARVTLAAADVVTAPSRFVAEVFARYVPGVRVEVAPLGLPRLPRVRRASGVTPVTLGYLGTIQPLKNAVALARAFSAIPGDARLRMHGHGPPEEVARLREVCRADARVTFGGPYGKEQLPELLDGLDALVVPSRVESYCFTAREALAAGVPVVAAAVGGLPEAVRHGENGLLFDPEAAGALDAVLRRILADPGVLRGLRAAPVAPPLEADAEGWLERYRRMRGAGSGGARGRGNASHQALALLVHADDWARAPRALREAAAKTAGGATLIVIGDGPAAADAEAELSGLAGSGGSPARPSVQIVPPGRLLAALREHETARWLLPPPR